MGVRERERLFIQFERWGFDERGHSPRTRRNYLYRVRAAETWLVENHRVSVVFAKDQQLREYLSSTTPNARNRNHIRQALLAFYDFCIDKGFRKDNPAAGIKRLPTPSSIPRALPADDAQRFLDAAKLFDARAEALACLLAYQGMRITEALTLKRTAVLDEPGWVRFVGKGGKERMLPLHEETAKALGRWLRENPDAKWVFPSPRRFDKPMSYTWGRKTVVEIAEMAGIDKRVHPHVFRHTYATTLLDQGTNLRVVQEALGHASLETTAIYLKVRAGNLKETLRLDYALGNLREDAGSG